MLSPTTAAVPRRRDRWILGGAAAGLAGLALVVTGSFLPWLASGPVLRNSYQVSGLAARLAIGGDGALTSALRWWPLLGPVYFLPVLVALASWRRSAGVLALLLGLAAVLLGVAVLAVASGRTVAGVRLVAAGPAVLAAGGLLYAAAGALFAVRPRPRVRRPPPPG